MRIVSLCPSLTELVFDLGLGDRLVGITRYCIHPHDGVAAVEKVAGTKDPDVARILELAPDVVLMNEEENRREDAELLEAAGLRIANSFPKTPLETATMVREIGEILDVAERAEAIAVDIEERSGRVRAAAAGRPTVSFAYLIWRKPWMTVNADTYPSAILEQGGGRNVFGGIEQRFPAIELADLIREAPERIYLCTEPFPFQEKHVRELSEATGWAPERFRIVDGEYLSWHGSRTPDGVDYAAELVQK